MARNRGKKALYEVIGKGSLPKLAAGEQEGQGPVEKPVADEPLVESPAVEKPAVTTWPKKPAIVQVNAGRIEFSLPYQIAIALLLGVVLVFLVVYRLGQMSYAAAPAETGVGVGSGQDDDTGKAAVVDRPGTVVPPSRAEMTQPAELGGKNAIVIVEYDKERDLRPVQEHFSRFGIETEIVPAPRGRYFLWTKERYDTVGPGSRCDRDKQKIINVGALYKAERGYETFGTQPFDDAYPRKVD
ncbi:MAG: hypothetical protein ACYST6_15340 [Planctomycetota bacterium]|jgi:hypothetical protein